MAKVVTVDGKYDEYSIGLYTSREWKASIGECRVIDGSLCYCHEKVDGSRFFLIKPCLFWKRFKFNDQIVEVKRAKAKKKTK